MNNPWVRRFHRSDEAEVRLVCFPYAGGSASYYYQLSELLAPRVEVLALQYPGRQDRAAEPAVESILEIAEYVYGNLQPWGGRAMAFFGHSMGTTVAYETSWQMQLDGCAGPARLFVSGYPPPSRLTSGGVNQRDDEGLVEELLLMGGTDPAWLEDPDLKALILPPLRSDYTALETYSRPAGPALTCPIVALGGDTDPQTPVEELARWAQETSGPFRLRVLPGGHFYLDDHWAEVAHLIQSELAGIRRPEDFAF